MQKSECPNCNETDHATNADFCHMCGGKLIKRRCRLWFVLSALCFVLAGLYRLLVYSSYLEVSGAIFSERGGAYILRIETNAVFVSAHVIGGNWFTITRSGKNIFVKVEENNGAKERQAEIKVYAGLLRSREATIHVVQNGKGATYIKADPESISVFNSKGGTVRLAIETDGDEWDVVSCPRWVTHSKEGNNLTLRVKENNGNYREGRLEVISYGKCLSIQIRQKEKPEEKKPVVPKPPKEEPKPVYPTRTYSLGSGTFSSIMVVDRELSANEADKLLSSYPGWRFETQEELLYIYQHYEYTLTNVGEGYWYYAGFSQGGGYTLGSLAYNYNGERDTNEYRNRVILVK